MSEQGPESPDLTSVEATSEMIEELEQDEANANALINQIKGLLEEVDAKQDEAEIARRIPELVQKVGVEPSPGQDVSSQLDELLRVVEIERQRILASLELRRQFLA